NSPKPGGPASNKPRALTVIGEVTVNSQPTVSVTDGSPIAVPPVKSRTDPAIACPPAWRSSPNTVTGKLNRFMHAPFADRAANPPLIRNIKPTSHRMADGYPGPS